MSDETITLELLGVRLMALTGEMRDLQQQFTGLEARFSGLKSRFDGFVIAFDGSVSALVTSRLSPTDQIGLKAYGTAGTR